MSLPGGGGLWGGGSLWGGGGAGGSATYGTEVGRGFLYPALRKAGVTLGPQRTPSPAQYQDAIEELNRLLGSLGCDRLFIYTMTDSIFPLSAGKNVYTIGISPDPEIAADLAAPRPMMIESANIVANGAPSQRWPLTLVSHLEWAKVSIPNLAGGFPEVLYNDRAYPLSTLYLSGVPPADTSLELFTWYSIPKVVTYTDLIAVPDGYEDAIVLNLAVRLAPHFQKVLDQNVREDARMSLMRLMSINAPQPIASTDALDCGCGGYDVYSDTWK